MEEDDLMELWSLVDDMLESVRIFKIVPIDANVI